MVSYQAKLADGTDVFPKTLVGGELVDLHFGEPPGSPTVPDPVSYFDFHEGSGDTASSIVAGGYTLTAFEPSTAWSGTAAAKSGFTGVVGPAGTTEWSVACDLTMPPVANSVKSFAHISTGNPWLNVWMDANVFRPGPWPPDQFGTIAIPVSTLTSVVYTFSATESKVYVDGALSGTFANAHLIDLSTSWLIMESNAPDGSTLDAIRFWNVCLTAGQVALL